LRPRSPDDGLDDGEASRDEVESTDPASRPPRTSAAPSGADPDHRRCSRRMERSGPHPRVRSCGGCHRAPELDVSARVRANQSLPRVAEHARQPRSCADRPGRRCAPSSPAADVLRPDPADPVLAQDRKDVDGGQLFPCRGRLALGGSEAVHSSANSLTGMRPPTGRSTARRISVSTEPGRHGRRFWWRKTSGDVAPAVVPVAGS